MPAIGITPEAIERMRSRRANGDQVAAIARDEGVSLSAVSKYTADVKTKVRVTVRKAWVPPTEKPAAEAKPSAPTKADVAEMQRAAVESNDFEEPIEQIWQREEERAVRQISKAAIGSTFRWRAPGPHLLLAFVSDQHIAPGTPCDFKSMREDAELIRTTPHCFALLGGDAVDNHIKHRAATLYQHGPPEDQYRLFAYYLQILGEKSLMMVSGNHDNWTMAFAGVDMLGRIAKDQRLCYAPDEAFMEIGVGTQTYRIAIRHQYRLNSSFNQTHAVKQWLRLGEREFDIGCVGHHHEHALESFVYRGKLCWGCRPGSYQITSAYSRQYGYNQSIPTTPAFLLRGDRRDIVGFPTLKAAIAFLGAAKELGLSC